MTSSGRSRISWAYPKEKPAADPPQHAMFEEIIGNKGAKELLERLIKQGRVPQSLLFTGKAGIGKKSFALKIAQSFVCTRPADGAPCGDCAACVRAVTFDLPKPDKRDEFRRVIFSGHPDVGMVTPYNQTIFVDAVRDLEREANFRPFEARARLFIIDDAEKLSSVMDNAANALLKTLEEPSESTRIILISSRPLLLLSTIRSRCQAVRFGPLAKDEIIGHLTNVHRYPSEDAALLAGLSQGSLGRALGIDLEKFRDLRKQMLHVVERCSRRDDYAALLRTAEQISDPKAKDSYAESLNILQTLIHDMWTLRKRSEPRIVNFDLEEELERLAKATDGERLSAWLGQIEKLREELSFNLNRKLATDALFMGMAA